MRGLGLPAADPWAAWDRPAHGAFPGLYPLRRKRPATLVPGRAGPWTAQELARTAPGRPFPATDLPSALWPAPSVAPVAVAGPSRQAGRSGTFVAKARPCGQSTRRKRRTGPCTCFTELAPLRAAHMVVVEWGRAGRGFPARPCQAGAPGDCCELRNRLRRALIRRARPVAAWSCRPTTT